MNKTPAYYLQKYANLKNDNFITPSEVIRATIGSIIILLLLYFSQEKMGTFNQANFIGGLLISISTYMITKTIWHLIKLQYYAYKHAKALIEHLKEHKFINYTLNNGN